MQAYLGAKRIRLDPARSAGKGGEADIYDIGDGLAAKIFKPPDHPDIKGNKEAMETARERIAVHQKKLPALALLKSAALPHVVLPEGFITEVPGGEIVGYAMPLVKPAEVLMRYSDRTFREAGVSAESIKRIFLDLAHTVEAVHRAKVVIGDFNDLNVLVKGHDAYLIDADSFQFGPYHSRMFTTRFVDPRLCDPRASAPILVRPYTPDSDWYAFAVMLMQTLLFVGPYGGVYRPQDPKKRLVHDARALRRITIFDPEVVYPKPAIHYRVLPDDLLDYFHRVFEKDERGSFPARLIETLEWKICKACGLVHARSACPVCQGLQPVKHTIRVAQTVIAKEVFRTHGVIVYAVYQDHTLKFVYNEHEVYRREGGTRIATGAPDPLLRFRIQNDATLVGRDGRLMTLLPGNAPTGLSVDSFGSLPLFDATRKSRFWVKNGRLMKDGEIAPEEIGEVLANQTIFWAGETFGFGFYRAGNLSRAFVFEPHARGLNDSVALPRFTGTLIDSTAVFANDYVWFFATLEEKGVIVNRAWVIARNGTLIAEGESPRGRASWLGEIRGKTAVGTFLFAPTDDGIVRVEARGGVLEVTREFPDTEPFVDRDTKLFADSAGIWAVKRQSVTHLALR